MGDLKGHAIPGSFFLLYGIWWAVNCLRRHLACHRDGTRYKATSVYALDCFQGRISQLPLEGFIKVILSGGGMLGELLAHLPTPPMGIVQHATMYFFFLLSGVVDLAMHYGVAIPQGTDHISLVVALVVEGLLFVSHVHGRSELDTHIHLLLVSVIFTTAVLIALQAKFNHSAILGAASAYLLMLQGSWFWAVGIILYAHGEPNTAWKGDSHESLMMATIYFSWHCATHFIILITLNVILYGCYYKRQDDHFKMTSRTSASRTENHYAMLSNDFSEDT